MVTTVRRALAALGVAATLAAGSAAGVANAAGGPTITPGMQSAKDKPTGGASECTVGFVVTDDQRNTGYLTAGHCDHGGSAAVHVGEPKAAEVSPVGSFVANAASDADATTAAGNDIGLVLVTNTSAPVDTRVFSRYRVSGILTPEELKAQRPELCKYGEKTGETCGPILDFNENNQVLFLADSEPGDSGSPVYVRRPDGTVLAVGSYVGRSTGTGAGMAEMIAPWLKQWGVKLALTP